MHKAEPYATTSANPRELVAGEHVDDSGGAEGGLHGNHGGMPAGHRADDGGVAAQRVVAHGVEHGADDLGGHDGDEFAFVGDIERVEAEEFAGAADHFADGDGGLVEFDADFSEGGDFVDGAGQTAARGIAHAADVG